MKKELPTQIPDLISGRDRRLIQKHQDDEMLDLQLYQWGIENGYQTYFCTLSAALKDWLVAILENAKGYEHSLEKLKHNITSNILLHYCMETIEALPLVQMGFKPPATKHALQHAVRRFLKKHGALDK